MQDEIHFDHVTPVLASGGWKASDLDSAATAWLAAQTKQPHYVLVNIGIGDIINGPPSQSAYETALGSLLDKIHAKWASTKVYVMRPWARTFDTACDTMDDVWIPNVLATRGTFVFNGPDERIILKNGDNGVSRTSDGTHPNALGCHYTALGWMTALGF